MPATQLNWLGARLVNGRYHVTTHLGEGGMGQVYRARDRKLGSDVVIKVPRPALLQDPEFSARFTREIRALVRLEHPHIVKVLDVDQHDGVPFAVLSYLAGGSLEDRLLGEGDGPQLLGTPEDLTDWLRDVAQALDFVHKKGFVHRDVKPANILFDAQGHVFLSDFGVAKAVAETAKGTNASLTGTGVVLGTPAYLAPEMALGKPFDGRADQYALAITVYELLAGRVPFQGATPAAVLLKQTSEAPPRLETVSSASPRPLGDAVHKALSKEPADRYPSCSAFAKAVLAGVPAGSLRSLPPPREPLRVSCPECGKSCRLPPEAWGRRVRCPKCQHAFTAPERRPSKPAARQDTAPTPQAELDTQKLAFAAPAKSAPRRSFPLLALILGAAAVVFLAVVGVALLVLSKSLPEKQPTVESASGDQAKGPKQTTSQSAQPRLIVDHKAVLLEAGKSKFLEVIVERNGHEGPIELNVLDLPNQVSLSLPRIPTGSSTARLELIAAADAEAGEKTARIIAKIGDIMLAEQCKVTVVASGKPAPPTAPPTVAIRIQAGGEFSVMRGSSKKLPVRIERQGYQGPISIELRDSQNQVQAPPVTLEGGKDEIELDLRALANATVDEVRASLVATTPFAEVKDSRSLRIQLLKRPGSPRVTGPVPPSNTWTPPANPEPSVTNGAGMKLVWIKPGTFLMGSPPTDRVRDKDEQLHTVRLTRGFYLGTFEVTQEQYVRVIGSSPSQFPDPSVPKGGGGDRSMLPAGGVIKDSGPPRLPVDSVTWDQAAKFCEVLSNLDAEKVAGRVYRLPTEAEWEYACRADTRTVYSFGDDYRDLRIYAWYTEISQGKSHPVGTKKPNPWGLFDMHGNLMEWCADWYDPNYYANGPAEDPKGPNTPTKHRVLRGGAWNHDTTMTRYSSTWLRCAHRLQAEPNARAWNIGFRVACDLVEPTPSDKLGKSGQGQFIVKPPQ
jgi:formylglycine-generating enzyme required for sulfatase activity/serine/threonine protein kinase